MAEVVANTGVSKDKGYLYYLGKDGNVWRSQMARAGKGGGNAEKSLMRVLHVNLDIFTLLIKMVT